MACLESVSIIGNGATLSRILSALVSSNHALHFLEVGLKEVAQGPDVPEWEPLVGQIVCNSVKCLEVLMLWNVSYVPWDAYFQEGVRFTTVLYLGVPISSDDDLLSTCKAAPGLQGITVYRPRCSHTGLAAIGKYCVGLKQLKLTDTAAVTNIDERLSGIAQGC